MLIMECLAVFQSLVFLLAYHPMGRKQPQIPKHCGAFLSYLMYARKLKTLRTLIVYYLVIASASFFDKKNFTQNSWNRT